MTELAINIEGTQDELQAQIIDAAARQLLQRHVYDEDGQRGAVPSALASRVESAVLAVIKEQAREATAGVVARILAREVITTDAHGYRQEPKTVEAIIAEEMKSHAYHGNSGRRGEQVFEQVIREQVKGRMKAALEKVVDEAREPILAAMHEEARGVFGRAMTKALPEIGF